MEQEGRVGVQRAAQVVQRVVDLADVPVGADHGPGHDVGVTIQILGAAVQGQVESPFQGPEIDRGGEGVVDDRDQAVLPSEAGQGFQVGHLHQGIGDGFQVEDPGVGFQGSPPGLGVVARDEVEAQAQAHQFPGDQSVSAPVETVLSQQVIAGLQAGQQRGGNGRHAAGGHQRRLAPFQRRQLLVKGLMVGSVAESQIADAVVVGFAPELEGG